MYTYIHGNLPDVVSDVFIFTHDINCYRTRQTSRYVLSLALLKEHQTVYSVKFRSSRI